MLDLVIVVIVLAAAYFLIDYLMVEAHQKRKRYKAEKLAIEQENAEKRRYIEAVNARKSEAEKNLNHYYNSDFTLFCVNLIKEMIKDGRLDLDNLSLLVEAGRISYLHYDSQYPMQIHNYGYHSLIVYRDYNRQNLEGNSEIDSFAMAISKYLSDYFDLDLFTSWDSDCSCSGAYLISKQKSFKKKI